MKISDVISQYILKMLESSDGIIEIQRNELALEIGCVPSQISYVITSRFTPEQGFIVKSRRGGGGCIQITKVKTNKTLTIMHTINSIGNKISFSIGSMIIKNLKSEKIISEEAAKLMESALTDRVYANVPIIFRDMLRAAILKNMLLTQLY